MKPSDVFQKVHALVEAYRDQAGPRAVSFDPPSGERRAVVVGSDYVADFQLAGQAALRGRHPRRWELFRLYYCCGIRYTEVMRELRIKKGTFDHWAYLIRIDVGKELQRRRMWPPSQYRKPTVIIAAEDELRRQIMEGLI